MACLLNFENITYYALCLVEITEITRKVSIIFSKKFVMYKVVDWFRISVRCLFKGLPIQPFSVVISFSTCFVFTFKSSLIILHVLAISL